VVDEVWAGEKLQLTLQGLAGSTYRFNLRAPGGLGPVSGARVVGRDGAMLRLEVAFTAAEREWVATKMAARPR
jgi:hypothetical protein